MLRWCHFDVDTANTYLKFYPMLYLIGHIKWTHIRKSSTKMAANKSNGHQIIYRKFCTSPSILICTYCVHHPNGTVWHGTVCEDGRQIYFINVLITVRAHSSVAKIGCQQNRSISNYCALQHIEREIRWRIKAWKVVFMGEYIHLNIDSKRRKGNEKKNIAYTKFEIHQT